MSVTNWINLCKLVGICGILLAWFAYLRGMLPELRRTGHVLDGPISRTGDFWAQIKAYRRMREEAGASFAYYWIYLWASGTGLVAFLVLIGLWLSNPGER